MFRHINNRQNQIINPDPEIREEQKADTGRIGNEAFANLISNNIVNNISNEANNADADASLSHYSENHLKIFDLKRKKKPLPGLNQISRTDNNNIGDNTSLNALITNEIINLESNDAGRAGGEDLIPEEISKSA